ncbi:DUF1549 and DUF1553 domain-containing protein [Tautonia marina]|uniref:DUF1549 and DUF1553 domain-containing protein n=1 Tax=Tautonia marina TaxID=2653855 RepID=UPI001260BCCD|nr:DUF1549 and DUF1553 domain-containing protein [Tautonia marina]
MHHRVFRQCLLMLVVAVFTAGCGGDQPAVVADRDPHADRTVASKQQEPPAERVPAEASPHSSPGPTLAIEPSSAILPPDATGLQFIVSQINPDGSRCDVTQEVVGWETSTEDGVRFEQSGYLVPQESGNETVTAVFQDGASVSAEVVVERSPERSWNFATDIVPIFTRFGCNSGSCHGKAGGQNGFHLSLFGYDPDADYQALTRDAGGRRLSLTHPESSLVLLKGLGRIPHGGGPALPSTSEANQTLLEWIDAGAPLHRGEEHGPLVSVEVFPNDLRLAEPGSHQIRVVAKFADGLERDVTRLSRFEVRDDATASVDDNGRVTLLRRAETDLIVRYQTSVIATRVGTRMNPDLTFDFASLPRRNLIDDHLFARLESLNVPPSPPADDASFLRRVSLDLTGQQPRPDQIRAFLDDPDPDRRIALVDRLMNDPLFVDFWHLKLGDLLQISQARFGNGVYRYNDWVKEQLASNTPWNEIVQTLLTSLGNPNDLDGGPVNYALEGEDAREQAELTAQRFLGLRFRCAQCHDHPFDRWTQDDYYGLAAFFAKVGRAVPNADGMMAPATVGVNPEGVVLHLRTGEPAVPTLPGGEVVQLAADIDPRTVLADWITAPDNPYFARTAANWAWAQFFGRGLAEPSDDLSDSNPPVHPELLDALADDFISHGFDLRHLIRTIASSEAYGLSSRPIPGNEGDTRLFSHQTPRPLTAHQMADALAQATDTELLFNLGRGSQGTLRSSKAVQVSDPAIPSVLLDTFGRCPRVAGCSTVATPTLSLRQALLLVGGNAIDDRISRFDGYLSGLLELEPSRAEIVENLYLRTLCRKPSDEESEHWSALMDESDSLREASEDLFWALLNSREFAFNH